MNPKRLLQISVVLLAATVCQPAPAQIVYSGTLDIPIPWNWDGVSVNISTGQTMSGYAPDWDNGPWFNLDWGGVDISNSALFRPVVLAGKTYEEQVVNLVQNSLIGSSSEFADDVNASTTHFLATGGPGLFRQGESGYMGFLFQLHTGSPVQYGWARLTIDNTAAAQGVLHEWAYQTTALTPINAGAIPEPGPSALALLTLTGLGLRRRGKKRFK